MSSLKDVSLKDVSLKYVSLKDVGLKYVQSKICRGIVEGNYLVTKLV